MVEWEALRAVDRLHYLQALLDNAAFQYATTSLRDTHITGTVYANTAEAREFSRQHVLVIDDFKLFIDQQMAQAKEELRAPQPT